MMSEIVTCSSKEPGEVINVNGVEYVIADDNIYDPIIQKDLHNLFDLLILIL